MTIQPIQPSDNEELAALIRSVLIDFNVPKVGTAYADPQLDCMYETYSLPNSAYFVIKNEGIIIGGAGVAPLANEDQSICELQKMYFLPNGRGQGLGEKMMITCLKKAVALNFKKCYLETMPYMTAAQKLYRKSGFEYLDAPMGNTGHNSCSVWMIQELKNDL